MRTRWPVPGKQFLVAALRGNLESPRAYRLERGWDGCGWGEPEREPEESYQRSQRYSTAGARPGVGSRRGANVRDILPLVTHESPSAEPSPKTRHGAGEGEDTGTRPCPAGAWGPPADLCPASQCL